MTEAVFYALLKREAISKPVSEHRFHPVRRWRFDYAWPDKMLALEVEGGAFIRGRHTRALGFIKDLEKYNAATVMGWKLLRVTPSQLCTMETVAMIKTALL